MNKLSIMMEQALQTIKQSGKPTFEHLIWDASGRLIACINGNTMRALERRGIIIVDHVTEHPTPWVGPNVFYRLVEQEEQQA